MLEGEDEIDEFAPLISNEQICRKPAPFTSITIRGYVKGLIESIVLYLVLDITDYILFSVYVLSSNGHIVQ